MMETSIEYMPHTIAVIILMVILYAVFFDEHENTPPGPGSIWWIVGYRHIDQLRSSGRPVTLLSKWAEQYGDVYRLYLGWKMAVVLNDEKIVKETFNRANVAPMLDGVSTQIAQEWSENIFWKIRNNLDDLFSDEGMLQNFKDAARTEAKHFCRAMTENGLPVTFGVEHFAKLCMGDVYWRVFFGSLFSRKARLNFSNSIEPIHLLATLLQGHLLEQENTLREDGWLMKIAQLEDFSKNKKHYAQLLKTIFQQDVENCSQILGNALFYAVDHPEYAGKIRKDRNYTFTKQLIAESQRMTVEQLSAYKRTVSLRYTFTETTKVSKYSVQKGSILFINAYHLMRNNTHTSMNTNADEFHPERFNQDGSPAALEFINLCCPGSVLRGSSVDVGKILVQACLDAAFDAFNMSLLVPQDDSEIEKVGLHNILKLDSRS